MTSASTLIRHANRTKNPALAKRLRAQAAKLRREAREAKKPGPNKGLLKDGASDPNVKMPPPNKLNHAQQSAANALGQQRFAPIAEQGWAPMPPDPIVSKDAAENLMKVARHKNTSPEAFQSELLRIAANAKYEAKKEAQDEHRKAIIRNNEQHHINAVCAFIAELEGLSRENGGPMPQAVVLSGYTVARVIDALKKAGYSAEGLASMSRGALEARLNR
jgi:hypothetical protein